MGEVRTASAVATPLRVSLGDVKALRYGNELMAGTVFASAETYPILVRLVATGWRIKQVERIDPAEQGRSARRLERRTLRSAGAVLPQAASGVA